jgi:hypothetical protein
LNDSPSPVENKKEDGERKKKKSSGSDYISSQEFHTFNVSDDKVFYA